MHSQEWSFSKVWCHLSSKHCQFMALQVLSHVCSENLVVTMQNTKHNVWVLHWIFKCVHQKMAVALTSCVRQMTKGIADTDNCWLVKLMASCIFWKLVGKLCVIGSISMVWNFLLHLIVLHYFLLECSHIVELIPHKFSKQTGNSRICVDSCECESVHFSCSETQASLSYTFLSCVSRKMSHATHLHDELPFSLLIPPHRSPSPTE